MSANGASVAALRKPRWYVPTPAKFLFAVLAMQGVLLLSAQCRWFWFNERKGFTVLIAVAATTMLLLVMAGAVVLSRFIKWQFSRGMGQFSLATLLLTVLAVAIPCAWLARDLRRAAREREIAQAVLEGGGSVECADTFKVAFSSIYPFKPIGRANQASWLVDIVGEHFFRDVFAIRTTDSQLVERFRELPQLRALDLRGMQEADAALLEVAGMPQITTVWLVRSDVTDEGIAHVRNHPNLATVLAHNTAITDIGLEHLQTLPKLTTADPGGTKAFSHLYLSGTQITDEGLKSIEGMTTLYHLSLDNTQITDVGLKYLGGLMELRQLTLSQTQVTNVGLEDLRGLTELRYLVLSQTQVTPEGVKSLRETLPQCEIFHR